MRHRRFAGFGCAGFFVIRKPPKAAVSPLLREFSPRDMCFYARRNCHVLSINVKAVRVFLDAGQSICSILILTCPISGCFEQIVDKAIAIWNSCY